MIVLDTNVVSEPLRPHYDSNVIAWLDRQAPDTLFLTSTSLAELHLGVDLLPLGKRRTVLDKSLRTLLDRLFVTRILDFDEAAALAYASLVSKARSNGKQIGIADGQIAAIAEVHGFAVATRDNTPFLAMGLPVIDPWNL